jgi:hypothetical protein
MLPIDLRVARAERLVRMIEQDAPLLAVRIAPLSRERQESTRNYAAELVARARAELKRLMDERAFTESSEPHCPQAAD